MIFHGISKSQKIKVMINQNRNDSHSTIDKLLILARVWYRRGNIAQAVRSYRKYLVLAPKSKEAFIELVEILKRQNDTQTLIEICQDWLTVSPDNVAHKYSNEVQNLYIQSLIQQGGMEAAYDAYRLIRQDEKTLEIGQDDMTCCVVLRNGHIRLPYFLDYYREQGITKFLIVENDSTDDSLAYLLQQNDVYVWSTKASYRSANCGVAWVELLLRRYAVGRWVLGVDIDEVFYYPRCEERSILDLCKELDAEGKTAYKAIMLDMYGKKSIQESHYISGTDFLDTSPYFDRRFYHEKRPFDGPFGNITNYWGGMRTRVFGGNNDGYLVNKLPLFKYLENDIICSGLHWLRRPLDKIASQRGALLHFKYFSSFQNYVEQELDRKEHALMDATYKQYSVHLSNDEALTPYDPLLSVRLKNSAQLIELGIMRESSQKTSSRSISKVDYFPMIEPLSNETSQPFWSIMIAVDKERQSVERTLRSVVSQLSEKDVQIELVCDQYSQQFTKSLHEIVDQIGDERVQIFQSNRFLDRSALMTVCIERARGQWVHILTGDDWLSPGFYDALRIGINHSPEIGAAFCRFDYLNSLAIDPKVLTAKAKPNNTRRILSLIHI